MGASVTLMLPHHGRPPESASVELIVRRRAARENSTRPEENENIHTNFGCGESGRHVRNQRRGAFIIRAQSMKVWKKTLPPILFVIAGVAFLFAALEERVIDGGPIHYTWLSLAITFFALAVVF